MANKLLALASFIIFLAMGSYYLNQKITADANVQVLKDLVKSHSGDSLIQDTNSIQKSTISKKRYVKRYAKNYDLSVYSSKDFESRLVEDVIEYLSVDNTCAILEENVNYNSFSHIKNSKKFHLILSQLNLSNQDATFTEYINIYESDDLFNELTKLSNIGHEISTYSIILYHADLLHNYTNEYPNYKLALNLTNSLMNVRESNQLFLIKAYLEKKLKSNQAESSVLLSQKSELFYDHSSNFKQSIIDKVKTLSKKAFLHTLLRKMPRINEKKITREIFFILSSSNVPNSGVISISAKDSFSNQLENREVNLQEGRDWSQFMLELNSLICKTSYNRTNQSNLKSSVNHCEIPTNDRVIPTTSKALTNTEKKMLNGGNCDETDLKFLLDNS